MTTPEWMKPGIYGAVIGAVFVGIVGFSWGGLMTGGGAHKMANAMAHDDVIAALVPVYLDVARTDPSRRDLQTTRCRDGCRLGDDARLCDSRSGSS